MTGLGLAEEYALLQEEMNRLHDGAELRARVDSVLAQLPEGPLALFSTSDQGAGLAAACAAQRDTETVWQRIHLAYAPPAPHGTRVVIVEPIDSGAAWAQAVRRRYPHATIVIATATTAAQAPLAA